MREPILVLGKYEIIESIGSGGMATVFRARMAGPMGFEKPVAVKVLREEAAADDEIVRMFIDEAKLGAKLAHHPNIASVLDFGEVTGRYYLAMEYVDGVSLAGLLKSLGKGRKARMLDPAVAVHVTISVLKALAYAHGANGPDGKPLGIVHRDVSPQNVLLDRSGAVKLCDFGIATGSYRGERTRVGVIKGKAGYMSPEQASGGKVDARSDLYSAALTLLAMLTGTAVYEGKDTSEVRGRAAKGVDTARIDALDLADPLKAVLCKALATKPADRFQSADEFLSALSGAAPDPAEAGRTTLGAMVEKAAEAPVKTRAKDGKDAKVANAGGRKPASKAQIPAAPGTVKGVRNLLMVAAAAVVIALLLALLKIGMPEVGGRQADGGGDDGPRAPVEVLGPDEV